MDETDKKQGPGLLWWFTTITLCAGCIYGGFTVGEISGYSHYDYTRFLDEGTITMAKYQKTFCKEHNICKREQMAEIINTIQTEAKADQTLGK